MYHASTVSQRPKNEKPQKFDLLRFSRTCDRRPGKVSLAHALMISNRPYTCKLHVEHLPGLSFMDLTSSQRIVSRLVCWSVDARAESFPERRLEAYCHDRGKGGARAVNVACLVVSAYPDPLSYWPGSVRMKGIAPNFAFSIVG